MTALTAAVALREALVDLMSYHDVPGDPEPVLSPLLAAGFAAIAAWDATPPADNPGDRETCIACDKPFREGDLYFWDQSGSFIHAACCGPERESYVGADGEPLTPDGPIPTPSVWTDSPGGDRMGVEEAVRDLSKLRDSLVAGNHPLIDGEAFSGPTEERIAGHLTTVIAALSPPQAGERREQIAREELDRLEALAKEATPGPWAVRSQEYDDWGWVRASDLFCVALARAGGPADHDAHRVAGTDPYAHNAAHIAAFDPPTVLRLIAAARLALPPQAAPRVVDLDQMALAAALAIKDMLPSGTHGGVVRERILAALSAARS